MASMASCAFFLLIIAAPIVWIIFANIQMKKRFEKRFPPISDEEFVARCGANPDIALKVRRIVADNLGVEYERIYPSTSFSEDLGAD